MLLFGDESEALTHPYLADAWAKKGADLRIPAPGQAAKVAMLGVLDWAPRELIVRTSRSKRSADFIALLEQIDTQYGLTPDRATKPIVLVLDNGPIHTSKATRAALAERAPWLSVEWLPKYAPELNDIEELWRDLKQHHLAHQTFAGPENLDDAIHEAVTMLNCERSRHRGPTRSARAKHGRDDPQPRARAGGGYDHTTASLRLVATPPLPQTAGSGTGARSRVSDRSRTRPMDGLLTGNRAAHERLSERSPSQATHVSRMPITCAILYGLARMIPPGTGCIRSA